MVRNVTGDVSEEFHIKDAVLPTAHVHNAWYIAKNGEKNPEMVYANKHINYILVKCQFSYCHCSDDMQSGFTLMKVERKLWLRAPVTDGMALKICSFRNTSYLIP